MNPKSKLLFYYHQFLTMSEKSLRIAIDMYNRGLLSAERRFALEIIDGLPLED